MLPTPRGPYVDGWGLQVCSSIVRMLASHVSPRMRPASLIGRPAKSPMSGPAARSMASSCMIGAQIPEKSICADAGLAAPTQMNSVYATMLKTRCCIALLAQSIRSPHRLRRIAAAGSEPPVPGRVEPRIVWIQVDEAALNQKIAHLEHITPPAGV